MSASDTTTAGVVGTVPQSVSTNPVDGSVNPSAATAQTAFDANAETRRIALVSRTSANMVEIVKAEREGAGYRLTKGYKLALEGARRYALTLDDLAAWLPYTANKDASGIELAVREISNRAIPSGGHLVIRDLVRQQRLCVDAADAMTHKKAQDLCSGVVERRQYKANTKAANPLKSDTEARELFDAAVKNLPTDEDRAAWEKCRTDPEALAQLARDLNAAQQENTRWRASLFVPFIHPHLVSHVGAEQNTQDGNEPDIDNSSIGKLWQPASAAAYKAVTSAVATAHAAKAGEVLPTSVVENAIRDAVTKVIGDIRRRETEKPSIEKVRSALVDRLFGTLDKLHSADINMLQGPAYEEIKALCAKHGLAPTPKGKGNGRTEELQKLGNTEQELKAIATQKTAESKAAEEQTQQENTQLAQAAIANAPTETPDAASAVATAAEIAKQRALARKAKVSAETSGK